MSASKRPTRSKSKEAASEAPKRAPAKKPPAKAQPKPDPKAKAKAKAEPEKKAKAKAEKIEKVEKQLALAVDQPSTKSKGKKAETPVAPSATKQEWNLDGAVPAEGANLPKKVGALLGVAQKAMGLKSFRPGQAEAFEHLLGGEDLLAVMPTGSGKSLLYQLTSLIVPGVTVVVSPLIALIKDQLEKMTTRGLAAVKIDSTLTVKQRREVDAMIRSPGGKLLLTTPERMADPAFREFLREACGGVGVSRFVVDEAHCVSQWGHDFRPAYLSLRKALEDVGRPPVLATTATAPPHVRDDILFQLGIEGATTVTTTFDRPNLHYEVISFSDDDEKMRTLVTLLKKLPRPGIVYCATVKKVEDLYESLTRHGIPVGKYHGRMNKKERDESQNAFMASADQVMIATNAFGLGVDKANIRNVLHYHVPGSLEAYAQEAGRGGRDGKPARCVLLFSPDDVAIQEYFLSGTYPTKRQVKMVFDALQAFTDMHKAGNRLAEETPPTYQNVALSSSVGQQRTRTVLGLLKDEGFVTEQEGGLFFVADPPPEYAELMERARQYEARRIADRQRLDALLSYVKAPGCRNQVILQYLGEPEPPKCGRCDNCLRSREAALAASTEATRLGASLSRFFDDEPTPEARPRREIKARVVRIDAPAPTLAPTSGDVEAITAPAAPSKPSTVLRRSAAGTPAAGTPVAAPPAAAPSVMKRSSAAVAAPEPVVAKAPPPQKKKKDDELDEDDDLDDDEDDDEDEDGELVDDDDDDDLDDDDDDDLDDDDDDDDEDDEVIDKTAAQLAAEGIEGEGVTVLARKKVPKAPKQRPNRGVTDPLLTPSAAAAEARRRRRRRRRKRRAMLPPKSAFTTPILSTAAPLIPGLGEAQPRRPGGGGGGPVIEYVRGPMRIAAAPVASANPNDAGVGRRTKKNRRWERGGRGGGGGGDRPRFDRGGGGGDRPRFDRSPAGPGGPNGGQNGQLAQGGPNPNGNGNGEPGGEGRRRRRRRRRRGPGTGQGNFNPNAQPMGAAGNDAPVEVFEVRGGHGGGGGGGGNGGNGGQPNGNQPPQLGPDGQPLRKRRRRRRRGRGGRQREWRNGAPGTEAGGEGGASSGGGGGDGGGSDGGGDGGGGGDDGGGYGSYSDE